MGIFSFLFGGKKKSKVEARQVVVETTMTAPAVSVAAEPVAPVAGLQQAKLRLQLVAALRSGRHAAAYEAAKGLADIQARAGRKTGARVWQQQAERIKSDGGLAA